MTPEFAVTEAAMTRLAAMWEYAGFQDPSYPASTGDVLKLAEGTGYRCDLDFVTGLLTVGALVVPMVNGSRQWGPQHLMALVAHLESRRRWKWPHPLHHMKFSQAERMQAEAEAAGHASCFSDFDKIDVEALLCLMAEAEQSVVRDALRIAILAKLRAGEELI